VYLRQQVAGSVWAGLSDSAVGARDHEHAWNLKDTITLIVSHSGVTFGSLAVSNLLQAYTEQIFVIASESNTQVGTWSTLTRVCAAVMIQVCVVQVCVVQICVAALLTPQCVVALLTPQCTTCSQPTTACLVCTTTSTTATATKTHFFFVSSRAICE